MFLYADDSCLVSQGKIVKEIEKKLNGDFTSTCEWFLDNKLTIHFGKYTPKLRIFASTGKIKKAPKLNITDKTIQIKQRSNVTYVGCILDAKNVRQSIFLKLINKISTRFKFLHRKDKFLAATLRRLFSFTLIMHPQLGPVTSSNI